MVSNKITNTKNILLIDDESDITFAIKNTLEDNNFKVDTFNDPILALKSYKANFYDLILLDIKMQKMDGFQLYNKLRERDPKVKICFLTASEFYYEKFRDKHSEWAKLIDKEYFFQKPIENKELIKRITAIISEKNLR